MLKRLAIVLFALIWVQPVTAQDGDSYTRLPSIELPPELDRVLRDYEVVWKAGDAEGLANLFTPDGFVSSRYGWLRGTESILGKYSNVGGDLKLRAHAYSTDSTVAYIVGAYGYGAAATETDQGKFVLALRMGSDGQWLIAADLDNSNRP